MSADTAWYEVIPDDICYRPLNVPKIKASSVLIILAFPRCEPQFWVWKQSIVHKKSCLRLARQSSHLGSRSASDSDSRSRFLSAEESSTATKANIPLNEIPQRIGVANQDLIQSQQDIRFADAAEDISGVNRDVLAAGSVGDALTIRGLPLGVFSNYYRDGFVFDSMVSSDSTDVDRVEVLKGPSSVLYGRAASGGIVNLITKEPPAGCARCFLLAGRALWQRAPDRRCHRPDRERRQTLLPPEALLQNRIGSIDVSHTFAQRWAVRSRFRAALTNWDYLDVSTDFIDADNRTIARFSGESKKVNTALLRAR